MLYLIWIPALILISILGAWVSVKNNNGSDYFWISIFISTLFVPVWPIVSKYSHSLLFDALLYDILVTFFYALAIGLIKHEPLNTYNWVGIVFLTIGFFLLKQ